jgi:predicted permease
MKLFFAEIAYLLRGRRNAEKLDEEMRLHLELRARKLAESGVPETDARVEARRRFGSKIRLQEESRGARVGNGLETIFQDVRYASRLLRRTPVFTLAAVATLALGIGANTAIFTLIDAYLLRPLPVHEPSRLVQLTLDAAPREESVSVFPFPTLGMLARERRSVGGWFTWNQTTFSTGWGVDTERIPGAVASGEVWRTLGIVAQAGRLFGPEDDSLSAPPVAVISDGYWSNRYHRSVAAIGSAILLDRTRFTIIGVLPRSFRRMVVGGACDVTVPFLGRHPNRRMVEATTNWWLSIFGRLTPGSTLENARAELATISPGALKGMEPHLSASEEKEFLRQRLNVLPAGGGGKFFVSRYRRPLFALIGVSFIVLLIGCLNLANLLLARAASRGRELAVRLALGAARKRLVRQFLTESLLLSLVGVALGMALAMLGTRAALKALVVADVTPDIRIFSFLAGLAVLATLLFGLLPALRGTDLHASDALKQARAGSSMRMRLQHLLVSAQLGLSVVLITGAFLFIQTFQRLHGQYTGFDRRNLVFVGLDAGRANLDATAQKRFFSQTLEQVRRLPFVRSASLTGITPLQGSWSWDDLPVERWPQLNETERRLFEHRVQSDYFRTAGLRLIEGRDFRVGDAGSRAAILSESAARTFFPGVSAAGRLFRMNEKDEWRIIGVVQEAKYQSLYEAAPRTMYMYLDDDAALNLIIKTATGNAPVARAVQSIVRATHQDVSVDDAISLDQIIDRGSQVERIMAVLASFFAVLASLLVAVGLYGLVGYGVTRRTTEIGVRMALGATRSRVLWMVMRDSLAFAAIGIAIGIPVSLGLSRAIVSILYETSAFDAEILMATAAIALAICGVAAFLPARRAAALDPMSALRWE